MKKFLRLILLLVVFGMAGAEALFGQCNAGSNGQWPTGTVALNTDCFVNVYATNCFTGEYSVCSGVQANGTYVFTSSVATDYITLTDGSNVVIGYGTPYGVQPLTFTFNATPPATIRVWRHNSSACDESAVNRTISSQCTSCPGPAAVTNQPSTATVLQGETNVQVLRVDLPRCAAGNSLTDASFDITSCTNLTDITNAKVYYTTTATFSTATQFGATVAAPAGTFTVTGTQTLGTTNYLWLVFDVSATAGSGNLLDAAVTGATIDGGAVTPTPANPTGTRTIISCSDATTVQPSTAVAYAGVNNNRILRVDLAQCAAGNTLTSMAFDISASTALSDISNAKAYFTTTATFSTATQFGTTLAAPTATFTMTGSQVLGAGSTNFVWLVFDLASGAVGGNIIDAAVTNAMVTIAGTPTSFTPVPANPAGTRTIVVQAGCTMPTASNFGTGVASTNPCTIITSTTCAFFNEYSTFTSVVPGNTYQFKASFTPTVNAPFSFNLYTTSTLGSVPVAFTVGSTSPLTINYTVPGGVTTIYVKNFEVGCASPSGTCHTFTIQCTSCPLAGTTQPSIDLVLKGAVNAQILRVDLAQCTAGSSLTAIDFDLSGGTDVADITSAKVYYTTTTTFATTTQFGSTVSSPGTLFTVNGTQTLGLINYLWLVVDVSATAGTNNLLDAAATSMTVAALPVIPSPTNPTGTRIIIEPLANDNCAGAILLTPNPNAAACSTPYAATSYGATQTSTTCDATGTNDDTWFTFTAGYNLQIIRFENVTATTGTVTAMGLDLYTVCGGTSSNCNTAITLSGGNGQVNLTTVAGTIYRLRVWTAGASNSATFNICVIDPPDMAYVSSTSVQDGTTSVTLPAGTGTTNNVILKVEIVVNGAANAFTAGDFTFNNTSNVPADVLNAKLYYTGTTNAFSTTNLVGNITIPNPTSPFVIGGPAVQLLVGGTVNTTNYFWLAFDLACTTTGTDMDAELVSFTVAFAAPAPPPTVTVPGPPGVRPIAAPTSYTSSADGNWSNPATWGGCFVPPNNTTAPITINSNVTFDVAPDFTLQASLTVAAGKTLTINANTLNIGTAGTATTQSLIINGTVAVGGGTVNVGTLATVTISSITLNVGGFLNVSSGTVTLGGTTYTSAAKRTISVNGTLNVSGGNYVGENGDMILASTGVVNLSAGSLRLGPVGGGSSAFSTAATLSTLNISGGTFHMNGSLTIGTSSTSTAKFLMSGGTLNLDPNNGLVNASGNVNTSASARTFSLFSNVMAASDVTGGNINFYDPPYATATHALYFSSSALDGVFGTGCTVTTGNNPGTTHTNTLNLRGFHIDCNISIGTLEIGTLIVSSGNYANKRHMNATTSTADITKVRNMTINSGAEVLVTAGPLGIVGTSLMNNGTITVTTTTADRGLVFAGDVQYVSGIQWTNGSVAQTLDGTGFFKKAIADADPTMQSQNRMASFSTWNSAGVTLNMPIAVTGSLHLNTNRLNTTSTNLLTIGDGPASPLVGTLYQGQTSPSTASTASTTLVLYNGGWVNGPLKRWFLAAVNTGQTGILPLGDGTQAQLASVHYTVAPTLGTLTSQFSNAVPAGNTGLNLMESGNPGPPVVPAITNPIVAVSPSGSWDITQTDGATGGTYTTEMYAKNFTRIGGVAIAPGFYNECVMVKRPSGASLPSDWALVGNHATTIAGVPTTIAILKRTLMTGFSQFALAGTFAALPIELKSFTGKIVGDINRLDWATASEQNVREFLIERSIDGVNGWQSIGSTPSKGNTDTGFEYFLDDRKPLSVSYYRLRSVDFDGEEQVSGLVVLVRETRTFGIATAFPVPSLDEVTIQYETLEEGEISLRVTDLAGRLVQIQTCSAANGLNTCPVSLTNLEAGVYLIVIDNGTTVSAPVRVVKQ